jgi:hypothetical protein
VVGVRVSGRLNADLTADADVVQAAGVALQANERLSFRGFAPVGAGFIVDRAHAERLVDSDPRNSAIVRPFRHGKCLTSRSRDEFIIDFGTRSENEARAYPVLFDIVRTKVKPERDAKSRRAIEGDSARRVLLRIVRIPSCACVPTRRRYVRCRT